MYSTMTSLKKNFLYQILYQILTIILPLITSPYLSRVLGAQGLGEYAYSFSVAYYFSLFILLGVNNHGTREISKIRDDIDQRSETFWSIYIVQLFFGVIVSIVYLLTQVVYKNNILANIQFIYVLSSILDINWLFFGLEKFKITVTRNMIIKIITVISVFLFVRDKNDLSIYTVIMTSGFFLSQLALWPFAKKEIRITKIKINVVLSSVKQLLILFVPVLAVSIFKYMDKIMLGAMYSKSELGLYDNTEKIISIPTSVITAVGTVMLPRISGLVENNRAKGKIMNYINLSMTGSIIIASALAFGIAAVSDSFSIIFWGEEFVECGLLMRVISITVIFLAWANVIRTQYLIPYGKDKIFVKATIYGAIINLAINFSLIKKYGAMGTIIGTVVAEFVVAFYQTIKTRKELPIKDYLKACFPYIVIGIIMFSVAYLVRLLNLSNFITFIIQVFLGSAVYIGLVLSYLFFIKKIKICDVLEFIRK